MADANRCSQCLGFDERREQPRHMEYERCLTPRPLTGILKSSRLRSSIRPSYSLASVGRKRITRSSASPGPNRTPLARARNPVGGFPGEGRPSTPLRYGCRPAGLRSPSPPRRRTSRPPVRRSGGRGRDLVGAVVGWLVGMVVGARAEHDSRGQRQQDSSHRAPPGTIRSSPADGSRQCGGAEPTAAVRGAGLRSPGAS